MNLSTDAVARGFHAKGGPAHGRVLMRVLVVYCHPVPDSFCAAVRDAAIEAIRAKGGEVRLIDLYAERFDPVMPRDERRAYNERRACRSGARAAHRASAMGRGDPVRLSDLVVRPAGDAEGLVRPRLGEGHRLRARRGRQDHAADDAYQARSASSPPAARRAGGRGSSASPAARRSCAASARSAPGAAGRCSWRTTRWMFRRRRAGRRFSTRSGRRWRRF